MALKKLPKFKAHSPPIKMTEVADLRRYCELVTRTSGVRLQFVPGAETAYTDGKTIFIPTLNSKTTERDAYRLGAYVVHESAHHRHGREYFDILKSHPMTGDSPLKAISNLIEDARINRATAEEFRGDGIRLSDGAYYCGMEVAEKYDEYKRKLKPGESLWDESTTKLGAVQMAQIESGSDWNRGAMLGFQPVFDKFFTDEQRDMASKLMNDLDFVETTRSLKNPEEMWEYSKKVYEFLYDQSAEEHLEQEKQKVEAESGKGKSKKGDGKEKGEGEGKLSKEPGEAGFNPTKGAIKIDDLMGSQHEGEWAGPGGHGMGYDYTDFTPDDSHNTWEPWGSEPKPINYPAGDRSGNSEYYSGEKEFNGWLRDVHRSSVAEAGFANQVRRLLQVRTAARYEHNHKHGRLHHRSAYRVAMPEVNGGDWNTRIFKQRKVESILKTNVLILVDWSGSMAGEKAAHACEAAVLINEVFSKVLKIPLEIISHSFTSEPEYGIIKAFDTPANSDAIRERFANFTSRMSGNDDHDALLFAYNRLRTRKAKRRVMIVLSDGAPADGIGSVYTALKETAASIEASKDVELYALGILDSNVKKFYKHHSVLKDVNSLEKTLLDMLNHIIID